MSPKLVRACQALLPGMQNNVWSVHHGMPLMATWHCTVHPTHAGELALHLPPLVLRLGLILLTAMLVTAQHLKSGVPVQKE